MIIIELHSNFEQMQHTFPIPIEFMCHYYIKINADTAECVNDMVENYIKKDCCMDEDS